jgi:hypothetical protein
MPVTAGALKTPGRIAFRDRQEVFVLATLIPPGLASGIVRLWKLSQINLTVDL